MKTLKHKKMKKLAVLFFAIAMSVTTTFANNDDGKRKEEVKILRNQIVKLLGSYENGFNAKADVTFLLNRNNQIVILSVNSKSKKVENFVKSKLNYRKIKEAKGQAMKIYKLPIKIVRA